MRRARRTLLVVPPSRIAAAALFALATGAVAMRTAGVHFIMITLAFGQMAFFTAASLSGYGGDDGYTLYGRSTLAGAALDAGPARLPLPLPRPAGGGLPRHPHAAGLPLRPGAAGGAGEPAAGRRRVGLSPYPYRLVAYTIAGGSPGWPASCSPMRPTSSPRLPRLAALRRPAVHGDPRRARHAPPARCSARWPSWCWRKGWGISRRIGARSSARCWCWSCCDAARLAWSGLAWVRSAAWLSRSSRPRRVCASASAGWR